MIQNQIGSLTRLTILNLSQLLFKLSHVAFFFPFSRTCCCWWCCFPSLVIDHLYIDSVHLSRKGSRLGHDTIVDGMLKDGLWDVYNDFGMGVCAELCADHHTIPREEQVVFCTIRSDVHPWTLVLE